MRNLIHRTPSPLTLIITWTLVTMGRKRVHSQQSFIQGQMKCYEISKEFIVFIKIPLSYASIL